jgi:predicted RNA binding protein YcfA (HicA-like mRNA interferase family)
MGSKLPLLKPREVQANLRALGFTHRRTDGSHETWERLADRIMPERKVVQVDNKIKQFDPFLMKSMIRQSGFTREEFCTGTVSPIRLQTTIKATPSTE